MAYLYEDGQEPDWAAGYKVEKHEVNIEKIVGISIGISGVLVVLIAALAVVDAVLYDGALRLGTWGFTQEMAIPTAICFILIGSTFILMASALRIRRK